VTDEANLARCALEPVSLIAAFAAGLLSFISPCVLPLIPGYISYISGITLEDMQGTPAGGGAAAAVSRGRILASSAAFVLGFSLVFVSLGASASALGQLLLPRLALLGRIAGAIIILFGLHTMGVLRMGWLYSEKRIQTRAKPAGFLGAGLVGVAFAFGWTPCIGPILAGILAIAAAQETVLQGALLLAVYSLGLGIPFLITALAINLFFAAFARIRRHYHAIEVVSGGLLVVIGVLILTNRLTVIARYLSPYLPAF
jgi:cytochrome c-type biogenesis protein